jgi:four helix bundle protein
MKDNMDNKSFAKDMEERTRNFALNIIRLSSMLPNTSEAKVVRTQMTKSGSSIGANYREANRARSKSDFQNRISICETEASETQYWIEIIRDSEWLPWQRLKPDHKECSELLAIFTSIGKNK